MAARQKKPAAKKAPAKKPAAKKGPAKKPAAKKPAAKKAPAKKPAAKKAPAKKVPAKKAAPKKAPAAKAPKKAAAKKAAAPRSAPKAAAAKPAATKADGEKAAKKAAPKTAAPPAAPETPKNAPASAAAPAAETKSAAPEKKAIVLPAPPPRPPPPPVVPERTGAVPPAAVKFGSGPATRLAAYVALAAAASSREVQPEDVVEAFLTAPVDENEGWQPLPWTELAASGYGHRIVELLGERLRGYRWLAQMLGVPVEERARVFAHLGEKLATKYIEGVEFLGRASEDLLYDLEDGFLDRVFGMAAELPTREKAVESLRHLVDHWRKRGIDLADDASRMLTKL